MKVCVALLCVGVSALAPPVQRLATPIKAVAPAVVTVMPLAAFAEEGYEYGAVAAPPWVLPLGAFLVIATALLPIALQAGDDAQREMAERDADTFGKRSPLDKKKR
ncbi:hypothetical protein CTAYLR_002042 [Chrysophaeum taylorii]|uniref:Uncharacterized protein n=1 Tax=Chrysophaeum taylorii TaxID=2483200 RepID=A0AAD7UN12_9STRA|nr:hypothetical protein CTAYLR_002042 [Chrysophaeum taylorii]